MAAFTESTVEAAALAWLESVGWAVRNGTEIAPGEPAAERADYGQVAYIGFSRYDGNLLDAGTHPVKYLQQHS